MSEAEQLDAEIAEIRQCITNRLAWLAGVGPADADVQAKRAASLQTLRDIEARLVALRASHDQRGEAA